VLYSIALIPVTLAPTLLGMAGRIYFVAALIMGLLLLYAGLRLTTLEAPITAPVSKQRARQLLQATVFYLPLLFLVMMLDTISS
jgi:protoheme IX farnesyltransferase